MMDFNNHDFNEICVTDAYQLSSIGPLKKVLPSSIAFGTILQSNQNSSLSKQQQESTFSMTFQTKHENQDGSKKVNIVKPEFEAKQ